MIEKQKFSSDAVAGFVSIAILGVSGLLINILVARYYDTSVLGAFNQVFAIYILGSQLGTFGVQFSILKHTAHFSHQEKMLREIFLSGLMITTLVSIVVATSIFILRNLIAQLMDSTDVGEGIAWAAPGLAFFSVNKYFLNTLNGLQKIKAFSLFTSMRYIALLAGVVLFYMSGADGGKLPVIFTAAEVLLFAALVVHLRHLFVWDGITRHSAWFSRHLKFGIKAMPGGVFAEVNTRVDVLMLGYFLSDSLVGIFSFAAMFAEGLMQFPLVIKRQMDPIITKYVVSGDQAGLMQLLRKVRNRVYVMMLFVGFVSIVIYPYFTAIVQPVGELRESWKVFFILMAFAMLQGGYIALGGILSQAGYPGIQTLYLLMAIITNVVLNIILIPQLGISGGAIATGITFVASVFYLKWLVAKSVGIRI